MLEVIGIIILIYLIIRLFFYYVLPRLLRRYMRRVKEKFYEQNPNLRPDKEETLKPGVKITYGKKVRKEGIDSNFGDYIDYEDINNDSKTT